MRIPVMTAIAMGTSMDRKETTVDVMSSAMLTGTLPAPAVVAVTNGRTAADLTRCTPPATRSPQARAMTGFIPWITFVLAANAIAPATGRTKVWIRSLT